MKNELFEKAKQAVAEQYGYKYENEIVFIPADENPHDFWEDVFKCGCNEAVKADRAETTNEAYYDSFQDDHVVSCKVLNRPLPFPQQPDGL